MKVLAGEYPVIDAVSPPVGSDAPPSKYPEMSTRRCALANVYSWNVPSGATGTMIELAMTSPTSELSTDVSGRDPDAHAVRNCPGVAALTEVMFATTASAPGCPELTVIVLPAAGIAPLRVFKTRVGTVGTSPAGPTPADVGDQTTAKTATIAMAAAIAPSTGRRLVRRRGNSRSGRVAASLMR